MTIPSQAEAKAASIATEIEPFELELKKYLELPATVAYLEGEFSEKVLIKIFTDKELTDEGIEALVAAITAAGWTGAVVRNEYTPAEVGLGISRGPEKKQLFVSFKPSA